MTHELRDLRIRKISLVRKGFRPINSGSVISIVKAQPHKEDTMSDVNKAAEASVLERFSKAFAKMLGDPEPDPTDPEEEPTEPEAAATTVDVEKAVSDAVEAKLKPLTEQVAALVARSEEISKAQPTDEHLAELIEQKTAPLAKAIEDFAVAFARQPKTPNVTKDIVPNGGPDPKAVYATVKDMEYGDALQVLLHGQG
jgi:hypothetical protein